jgi:Gas vesicle protein
MRRSPARHSTVPSARPPKVSRPADPPPSGPPRPRPPRRQVARIVDESEASLLDLIDNLLNRGVVLNADLILALANVDLVYVRLSALLCAADRLAPRDRA